MLPVVSKSSGKLGTECKELIQKLFYILKLKYFRDRVKCSSKEHGNNSNKCNILEPIHFILLYLTPFQIICIIQIKGEHLNSLFEK